jgi:hypothetical protein
MLTSVDIVFASDSCAHLVVGRSYHLTGTTVGEFRDACRRVDAWAATHRVAVVLLTSGDFSGATGPAGDDHVSGTCVVGFPVLTVDDALGTWPVDPVVVDAAVVRARELRWDHLSALLSVGGAGGAAHLSDIGVYTVATGPSSGVVLAYGVPLTGTSYPHASSATAPARPALAVVAAGGADHRPRARRVYGITIVARSHREDPTELVDLSPAARRRHRARLGVLADQSSYQLMSHFTP